MKDYFGETIRKGDVCLVVGNDGKESHDHSTKLVEVFFIDKESNPWPLQCIMADVPSYVEFAFFNQKELVRIGRLA